MTPAQKAWAEKLMGTTMKYNVSGRGVVVDYKEDAVGMGVFFVLDIPSRHNTAPEERYQEQYAEYPRNLLRNKRRSSVRGQRTSPRSVPQPRSASHSRSASSRWHGGQ
jgi:hypothetical protein